MEKDLLMIKFGTGGFRGIIGDDFTKDNIKKISQGIADVYKEKGYEKPIVVGYDFRFISDKAAIWVAEVLAANRINVLLANSPSPTPAVMERSKTLDNEFGVMITASHNPYWFNGLKLFQKDGMDAEKELTDHLEKRIDAVKTVFSIDIAEAKEKGLIKEIEILEPYLVSISKFIKIPENANKNIRILLDPIYGTGALTLEPILRRMGFNNIKVLHSQRDPFFGGLLPNPIERNMQADRELLLSEHYDLCIGTDSDCDRIAILDEKGNYVDANEVLGSLYYYLIKYRRESGDIVKNLATSDLIDALAYKFAFKCHEVDVGFKNISQGMKDYDCLLGGESSGGLTMRGYIYGKDSTFASALFLEMLASLNKLVSEIIKEVRDFASFHKHSYEDSVSFNSKDKILNAIKNKDFGFKEKVSGKEFIANNVKYRFSNGDWALLRFSGTEPLIRIFYETESEEVAKEGINTIKEFIKEND